MTDGVEGARLPARARGRSYVRFSAKVARVVLRRAALGEPMLAICRDAEMPTHGTVRAWARKIPVFREALALAREAAAWAEEGETGVRGYCEDTAAEIFARMCRGEALIHICADPKMPGKSTVYRWRERVPAFNRALRVARDIQAETLCEESWEIAQAVTPATAHAARVTLEHARWMVTALAPQRFARVKPRDADELDGAKESGMTVIVRQFTEMEPGETLESLALAQRAQNAEAEQRAQAWLEQSRARDAERARAAEEARAAEREP